MKIVIIPSWLSTNPKGFAGAFIVEQANALAHHNIDVSMIYLEREGFGRPKINSITSQTFGIIPTTIGQGKTVPKLNSFLINQWYQQYEEVYQAHSHHHGQPEILHAHGYIAGFVARRLSEKYRIPFIITEHSSALLSKKTRPWHQKEIQRTYESANAIIAVSSALKQSIESYTRKDIHVIPNLVNDRIFHARPDFEKTNHFNFIFVGGLIPLKRVDAILNALSNLNDHVILTIVGDGPERQKLEHQAKTLELENRVTFKGVCPPEEVANEMRKANALITVSEIETFGKVIIEALSCGTPVLAAESADPDNIVIDTFGLRISKELSELPNAMRTMIGRSEQYMAKEIHQRVAATYGETVICHQLTEVYNEVLRNTAIE